MNWVSFGALWAGTEAQKGKGIRSSGRVDHGLPIIVRPGTQIVVKEIPDADRVSNGPVYRVFLVAEERCDSAASGAGERQGKTNDDWPF